MIKRSVTGILVPSSDGVLLRRTRVKAFFSFYPEFIKKFAGDKALADSAKVHFTPTSETCEDARADLRAKEVQLREALNGFGEIKDKADFRTRAAMDLKSFQKAHVKYDKMGCDENGEPAIPEDFVSSSINKLREVWMSIAESDDETAGARFDDAVAYIKEHTNDMTLKVLIKASGIAFGTSLDKDEDGEGESDEIDVDADLDEDGESDLEDVLVGDKDGGGQPASQLQIGAGQVAAHTGSGPAATTFAVGVVAFAVMIGLFVLLCYVAYWLFIVALCISLGILAYNGIVYLIKR